MRQLETKRLILREWSPCDAADVYEYASGPVVGPMAGWKPHENIEESKKIIDMFIKENETWAIVLKETGRVIGSVGLHKSRKGKLEYERELGYVLSEKYWGQGIIPEAASAVLDFGFRILGTGSIIASHFDFNLQSKRVIEKLGFRHIARLENSWKRYDGVMLSEEVYMMTAKEYFTKRGRGELYDPEKAEIKIKK
jgi:RimJ/RimL family protein N-acetyltransferase